MSAEIVQIRDYQHPREIARSNDRIERLGLAIITQALMGEPGMCGMEPVVHIEIPGQGIDGMFNMTGGEMTACSEMNPDKDSA